MWRGGLGATYLLPALSFAGASIASPCFRFHIPLIEPDVRISCFKMSSATFDVAKSNMWLSGFKPLGFNVVSLILAT
jgi:hypothetical protein